MNARRVRVGAALLWTACTALFLWWRLARDQRTAMDRWEGAALAAADMVRRAAGRAASPEVAAGHAAEGVLAGARVLGAGDLDPAILEAMRADEAPRRVGDAVAAPLKDGDDWDVVGAVLLERPAGLRPAPPLRPAALLPPLLLALAVLLATRWSDRAGDRRRSETLAAWGFLAAPLLHLAVFSAFPVAATAALSLHRWDLLAPSRPYVGLANYRELAADPLFWTTLRNTALYTLYVPITMVLALALAVLLQRGGRTRRMLRAVAFLPFVSSVVAIGIVWQWMFSADFGLVNAALRGLGLPAFDWLGDPRTALGAIIAVTVWTQVGYQMVIFVAGLQGVPRHYLDAAFVDGASPWRRFRHVTLPLLRPVILFVLVTGVIAGFQVFTLVYLMTEGGPLHSTDVLVYRIYQTGWEFLRFGSASAMAVVLLAVLLAVTVVQFRLLGRRTELV